MFFGMKKKKMSVNNTDVSRNNIIILEFTVAVVPLHKGTKNKK